MSKNLRSSCSLTVQEPFTYAWATHHPHAILTQHFSSHIRIAGALAKQKINTKVSAPGNCGLLAGKRETSYGRHSVGKMTFGWAHQRRNQHELSEQRVASQRRGVEPSKTFESSSVISEWKGVCSLELDNSCTPAVEERRNKLRSHLPPRKLLETKRVTRAATHV